MIVRLTDVDDALDVVLHDVIDEHVVAALDEVGRHVRAHVAESDEADARALPGGAACATREGASSYET